MENYDLIIAGLGPGGLRAAKNARAAGLSVLAFEKNRTGGCCLNFGCIPTKAIMHSAELFKDIKECEKSGITANGAEINFEAVLDRENKIVNTISNAAEKELIKSDVKIIKENAEIDFENLEANGFRGKNIIVATGSVPLELKDLPFNGETVLSSDDILNLKKLPKSIGIIGSGAIGTEWARIFRNFGVNVTVVEKAPNLLPQFDISIQKRIERIFKINKIKFYKEKTAKDYSDGVLTLDDGTEIEAEIILVAAGRKKVIPHGLQVYEDLTTNYKNVYGIGDICARKMLAHTASTHADYIIKKITGKTALLPLDTEIPSVIYGSPEIASIGLNEQDTTENRKIYEIPVSLLPKAWCDNSTDGFIKIIAYGNKIAGAHIVCKEASALAAQIQIAMKADVSVQKLKDIVFAHPTYSEGIFEALSR